MQDLNLSTSHPFCYNQDIYMADDFVRPDFSKLPNDHYYENDMTIANKLLTIWCQVAPALLAMCELWLRLFAFVLAPCIIVYLLTMELRGCVTKRSHQQERMESILTVIGLASSLVLCTDTLYVQVHNGRQHGASLFIFMALIVVIRCRVFRYYQKSVLGAMGFIFFITIYFI